MFKIVGTLVLSFACMPLALLLSKSPSPCPPLLGMDHDGTVPSELLGDLTYLIVQSTMLTSVCGSHRD